MLISSSLHRERFSCGINLLREAKCYEAHEIFEALFREAEGPSKNVFRAHAQLAASYHQLTLGRARASVRTWMKCRTKFAELGILSAAFDEAVAALHRELAIDAEGPRFLSPEQCARLPPFPVPDHLTG